MCPTRVCRRISDSVIIVHYSRKVYAISQLHDLVMSRYRLFNSFIGKRIEIPLVFVSRSQWMEGVCPGGGLVAMSSTVRGMGF